MKDELGWLKSRDWIKCALWTGVVGICLGFWSGVVFTLLEVHPWT